MLPVHRLCIGWPKPRARLNCCSLIVTSGATRWRSLHFAQGRRITVATHALTGACKRSLSGLPGGGGTPLATAIDTAASVAEGLRRRGQSPVVVLLTDGRANVARDGTGGRERAQSEATQAARQLSALQVPLLFIDTSPKPQPEAAQLAGAMRARYLPLPHAGAAAVSLAVRAAPKTERARLSDWLQWDIDGVTGPTAVPVVL